MAFKFPFSTLHELNLDWILEQVKKFSELIPPMETAVDDVQALQTDVEQAVEDASAAVQDAAAALETAEEAKEIAEQAAQGTIADGAVTTAKLDDGAVTTAKIADGAVTGNKIGTATIQTGNLSQGCVTTVQILDGTIVSDDLSTESVTTDKIGTSAVTTGKINDGAVTTAKIGAGAVATAKIADGAVTPVKVPNGDGTFTRYDPDGVVSTWWASTVKYWGAIGSLTLAMQITLPSDSTYHTIGTIESALVPSANIEQTEAVGADTHAFTMRIGPDGSVSIKNTSGSNIASKAVAIQILYLMNIT